MLKGSDVIGLPVVTYDTGERLDKVSDVVFDHESRRVLGLVVDDGGWFRDARVVPFEAARTIGPDAVIVSSRDAVTTPAAAQGIRRILEQDNILKGTRIVTTDGHELGTLRDLYFDERTGDVEGFEVSGGMFADAYEGRSFVPAASTLTIGEAVAFVTPETLALMEEQVGGVRGALERTGRRVNEAAGDAGDRVRAVTGALGRPPETLEEAWGRRVKRDVRTAGGYLVAARGQLVTDPVIARAREAGCERDVLDAVTVVEADDKPAELDAFGSRVREGAQSVQAEAKNLWERIKEKSADARDRAAAENEQRRINGALGRPVTRVILDRGDRVILNVGEIITHRAVEMARTEGVLEILLDAVATGEPTFSEDYLRAPEPGRAALEGSQVPVQDRPPEVPRTEGGLDPLVNDQADEELRRDPEGPGRPR